jgi:hypothetical protein
VKPGPRLTARWWVVALAAAALAAGLAGCASKMEQVTELKSLLPDEVMLVGQVLLDPPLGANEQNVDGSVINVTSADYKEPMVVFDDRHVDVKKEGLMAHGERTEYANFPFGQTFFVKTATRPVYINSTVIYMQMTNRAMETYILQTDLMVEFKPGDRAVYFGTIRYKRNDFWDLEKITVVDDYAHAKREYEKRYGKTVPLMKRLAHRVPDAAK